MARSIFVDLMSAEWANPDPSPVTLLDPFSLIRSKTLM